MCFYLILSMSIQINKNYRNVTYCSIRIRVIFIVFTIILFYSFVLLHNLSKKFITFLGLFLVFEMFFFKFFLGGFLFSVSERSTSFLFLCLTFLRSSKSFFNCLRSFCDFLWKYSFSITASASGSIPSGFTIVPVPDLSQ